MKQIAPGKEIEKRYLLAEVKRDGLRTYGVATSRALKLYETVLSQGDRIQQGYLQKSIGLVRLNNMGLVRRGELPFDTIDTVRLRRVFPRGADQYVNYLTIKSPEVKGSRGEYEMLIADEDFNILWPRTNGRRVYKNRLLVKRTANIEVVLDAFTDRFLLIQEEEFPSIAHIKVSTQSYGYKDITKQSRYSNKNLAK